MAVKEHNNLVWTDVGQPFGGVLANCLQQSVADHQSRRVRYHQGLVDESSEESDHIEFFNIAEAADLFSCVELESAGEHRQAPEQDLFGFGEQVIGPVDDSTQGLMTRKSRSASSGEQPETFIKAVVQVGQRH